MGCTPSRTFVCVFLCFTFTKIAHTAATSTISIMTMTVIDLILWPSQSGPSDGDPIHHFSWQPLFCGGNFWWRPLTTKSSYCVSPALYFSIKHSGVISITLNIHTLALGCPAPTTTSGPQRLCFGTSVSRECNHSQPWLGNRLPWHNYILGFILC